ncbi:MAG: ribosomal protein S18-alanine N-acetyltransferase [Anaerolineaceae bacterium]|nr:ribosomal protein S18-alanine N-acetyltransferase [Anaerolineaceae bacterium]
MQKEELKDYTFRPMTIDDEPQVKNLDVISFKTPWPSDAFRYELMESNNSICWIAEMQLPNEQPKVVGSVIVWIILDEAHVATLAVKPEFRGLGIARRLLAISLRVCKQRGATQALLEVRRSNEDALHLYYGFGFEIEGIRPGYYADNHEDALLLTLKVLDAEKLAILAR